MLCGSSSTFEAKQEALKARRPAFAWVILDGSKTNHREHDTGEASDPLQTMRSDSAGAPVRWTGQVLPASAARSVLERLMVAIGFR